jgi:glycosyltransferase involved in cell wall biosynthesis
MLKSLAKLGHEVHFINKKVNLPGAKYFEETVKPYPEIPLYVHPEKRPTQQQLEELQCDTLYHTFPPAGDKAAHYYDFDTIIFDSVDEPDGVFKFWNDGGAYYKSLRSANYVIASAKRLLRKARRYNNKVIYLPNACDFDFFRKPMEKPELYNKIKKPIILYSGAIATWVDIKLIEDLSKEMTEYQFISVGAEMNDRINKELPNLKVLGHQPYEDIPAYVQHADVCMIPFKTEQKEVQACNPIKLWEFFACGKPVVTTDMPETNLKGVYWSQTKQIFKRNIKRAIEKDTEELVKERIHIARENSWDIRAQNLVKWIDKK